MASPVASRSRSRPALVAPAPAAPAVPPALVSAQPRQIFVPAGLALLSLGLLSACHTGPKALTEHQAAAAQRWQELAAQPDRPVALIDWADAVAKMEAGNIKLQQAREAVRAGEEAVKQVPYNYIPELSLNVFAYPTLRTIGDGQLGDTFFFLGGLVSLPNPVRYQAEALQARLQFMSAQVDGELLRRDLHVRLYRIFRQAARLAHDDSGRAALAQLAASAPGSPADVQSQELSRDARLSWQAMESDLAELLGDYSKHWRPDPVAHLPGLNYAAHPPALDGRDRFAALQITRTALQLLALDAQRQGLLVAEWPQVAVLLNAPPIYQRSAGRESYLSLGDVRVSGYISYGTDFRGTRALARAQSARRSELTRRELALAQQAAMGRLKDGLALLAQLDTRLGHLHEAETTLENAGALVAAENLSRQAAELAEEVDDLNFSFWVLDDPRWSLPP
jgi:hypothetical protein